MRKFSIIKCLFLVSALVSPSGPLIWALENCKALDTIDQGELRQLEFYLSLDKSFLHASCKSESLLMRAIRLKNISAMEILLKYKVDPNVAAKAANGHTMYPLAAALDDPKIAELLIRGGADVKSDDGDYLRRAAVEADVVMVKLLIKSGAAVNKPSKRKDSGAGTPLISAVQSHKPMEQKLLVISALLDAGADPNLESEANWFDGDRWRKVGDVPVLNASCNLQVIELLVSRGADVNARAHRTDRENDGDSVLHSCIQNNADIARIERLVKIGFVIKPGDFSALTLAAEKGQMEMLEYLTRKGIALPESRNDRLAILTKPLKEGEPDVVLFKRLLAVGASKEEESLALMQGLEYWITQCNVDYAKKLVSAGAIADGLILDRNYAGSDSQFTGSNAQWLEANIRAGNCSLIDWKACRTTLGYLKSKGVYRAAIPSPSKAALRPLEKQREDECAALSRGR